MESVENATYFGTGACNVRQKSRTNCPTRASLYLRARLRLLRPCNLRQHGDDVRWASFSGPRYPVLVSVRQWLGKAHPINMRAHAQFWSESFSCCYAGEEQHFHHVGQRSVCAILPDIVRMKLDARNCVKCYLAAGACRRVRFVTCHGCNGTTATAGISAGAAIGMITASEAGAMKDGTLICIMRTLADAAPFAWYKILYLHSIEPMLHKCVSATDATHRNATLRGCLFVGKCIKYGVQVARQQ